MGLQTVIVAILASRDSSFEVLAWFKPNSLRGKPGRFNPPPCCHQSPRLFTWACGNRALLNTQSISTRTPSPVQPEHRLRSVVNTLPLLMINGPASQTRVVRHEHWSGIMIRVLASQTGARNMNTSSAR